MSVIPAELIERIAVAHERIAVAQESIASSMSIVATKMTVIETHLDRLQSIVYDESNGYVNGPTVRSMQNYISSGSMSEWERTMKAMTIHSMKSSGELESILAEKANVDDFL